MKTTAFLFIALGSPAFAQDPSAETWSRALIESPHSVTEDIDALVADWVDRIAADPAHPLVEAALIAIDANHVEDSRASVDRVLALRDDGMTPLAAAQLARLQAQLRLTTLSSEQLAKLKWNDVYSTNVHEGWVLGPLADMYENAPREALFAQPGFDVTHTGLWNRSLRWQVLERAPAVRSFDVEDALTSNSGWALCAFGIATPTGGPGWLEVDLVDAAGPHMVSISSAREGASLPDALLHVSINGAAPELLDHFSTEQWSIRRLPIVWRAGANRVLISTVCGARMNFALRPLASDGRVVQGWTNSPPDAALGKVIVGKPPPVEPISATSYLESLSPREPYSEALLGGLAVAFGRYAAGFEHLDKAVAAAPTSVGIRALAAELYGRASHLPDSWRRQRARAAIEAVLADEPHHVPTSVAHARILAPEDKEEDAIAALIELANQNPTSATPELELASIYPRLDMTVSAEASLLGAFDRQPRSHRVVTRLADHWSNVGNPVRAIELLTDATERRRSSNTLQGLAALHFELGATEEALAALADVCALSGTVAAKMRLIDEWIGLRRLDDADSALAKLESTRPFDTEIHEHRADIARLRGDVAAERAALERGLKQSPSDWSLRASLRGLGATDSARATFAKYALDLKSEPVDFTPRDWSDHVVRAIDAAIVHVFEDGAFEQLTVERDVANDLEGCESLGKQAPRGEMLRIATIKGSDGSEYEPVLVDDEYVMPALQPGDTVESISIASDRPPHDGRPNIGRWFFASVERPFALSRYVISLPKSLGLELVEQNFTGVHDVHDEGERIVHVFEVRNSARVVPEPGSPPTDWYLPWIEFGQPWPAEVSAALLAREVVVPTRVTPTIAAAAEAAVIGIEGQEARARALHEFVVRTLDKRNPAGRASATAALLQREGNGTILYAALLAAVGIDHEIFWSRAVEPDGDPEPHPAFPEPGRWARAMLIQVRPNDGPAAWCDMAFKTMPYGRLLAYAPRAEVFGTRSREWSALPDVPMEERIGQRHQLTLKLSLDRSAEVELELDSAGNLGFYEKEGLREVPQTQLKRAVTARANRALPGLDIAEFELRGLASDDQPVAIVARGRHKSLLDASGEMMTCRLPFPPLQLSSGVGGSGERKQALRFEGTLTTRTRVRVELPEGLELVDPPSGASFNVGPMSYVLAFEDVGPRGFTIVRELLRPAHVIPAADVAAYLTVARAVDQAERAQLRFKVVR